MPTLIIGLGGTGTKVVRKLRERWEATGIPSGVALAVVDARRIEPENGRIEGAAFQGNDPVDFPKEYNEFKRNVAGWWPRTRGIKPVNVVDFSSGCGAVRPYGRFFAFRFAQKIEATINMAVQDVLMRTPARAGERGHAFEVFLVGSLGNGTGGGLFMDVAAMVKQILANNAVLVRCYGLFIPGSVTRKGNAGTNVEARIGASGYAALLEMQYEMNRNTASQFRPTAPYVFDAWNGVRIRTYAADGGTNNPLISPIDYAFLMDERDRSRLVSTYPTLLNIAAEGLAMMVGGADADARLLDGWVHVPNGKCFGSFGAARLRVPAEELLDYLSATQAVHTIRTAEANDVVHWQPLLALESRDRQRKLAAPKITVKDSVDFFLEHVATVKEAGEFNQLIGRFGAVDDLLRRSFAEINAGMSELKKSAEIISKAREICLFVDDRVRDLDRQRAAFLLEGTQSEWLREPTDPAEPVDAGVKWHIDQATLRFVRAGAFGLLKTWLTELKAQIEAQKASIGENERRRFLANPEHGHLDLAKNSDELADTAESFIGWFNPRKIREGAQALAQDATNKFEFLLWFATLSAIEQFYDRMYAYADTLERGALQALSLLGHDRMTSPLSSAADQIAKELEDRQHARINLNDGLKAEFHIGGEASMRDQLLRLTDASAGSSTVSILEAVAIESERLFIESLGKEAGAFTGQPLLSVRYRDRVELIDEYRERIAGVTRKAIDPLIRSRCTIDAVLAAEADSAIDEFIRVVIDEVDAVDPTARLKTLEQLKARMDSRLVDQILSLDWARQRKQSREKAIRYYLAGRMFNLTGAAIPQWSITSREMLAKDVIRYPFFTFNDRATRVAEALTLISTLGIVDPRTRIKAQTSVRQDPRQVDILVVEIGGDLEALDMNEEKELYHQVMKAPENNFCPHLTEAYIQAVKANITLENRLVAPLLLALAEFAGFVSSDRVGNYQLAKDLVLEGPSPMTFAIGHGLGRGLITVVRSLEDFEGDFPQIRQALQQQLAQWIRDAAIGTVGQAPLGWDGIAKKISGLAARYRKQNANELDAELAAIRRRQDEDLNALANEIKELQGRGVPTLLSDVH